jgi:hypothetical protein
MFFERVHSAPTMLLRRFQRAISSTNVSVERISSGTARDSMSSNYAPLTESCNSAYATNNFDLEKPTETNADDGILFLFYVSFLASRSVKSV